MKESLKSIVLNEHLNPEFTQILSNHFSAIKIKQSRDLIQKLLLAPQLLLCSGDEFVKISKLLLDNNIISKPEFISYLSRFYPFFEDAYRLASINFKLGSDSIKLLQLSNLSNELKNKHKDTIDTLIKLQQAKILDDTIAIKSPDNFGTHEVLVTTNFNLPKVLSTQKDDHIYGKIIPGNAITQGLQGDVQYFHFAHISLLHTKALFLGDRNKYFKEIEHYFADKIVPLYQQYPQMHGSNITDKIVSFVVTAYQNGVFTPDLYLSEKVANFAIKYSALYHGIFGQFYKFGLEQKMLEWADYILWTPLWTPNVPQRLIDETVCEIGKFYARKGQRSDFVKAITYFTISPFMESELPEEYKDDCAFLLARSYTCLNDHQKSSKASALIKEPLLKDALINFSDIASKSFDVKLVQIQSLVKQFLQTNHSEAAHYYIPATLYNYYYNLDESKRPDALKELGILINSIQQDLQFVTYYYIGDFANASALIKDFKNVEAFFKQDKHINKALVLSCYAKVGDIENFKRAIEFFKQNPYDPIQVIEFQYCISECIEAKEINLALHCIDTALQLTQNNPEIALFGVMLAVKLQDENLKCKYLGILLELGASELVVQVLEKALQSGQSNIKNKKPLIDTLLEIEPKIGDKYFKQFKQQENMALKLLKADICTKWNIKNETITLTPPIEKTCSEFKGIEYFFTLAQSLYKKMDLNIIDKFTDNLFKAKNENATGIKTLHAPDQKTTICGFEVKPPNADLKDMRVYGNKVYVSNTGKFLVFLDQLGNHTDVKSFCKNASIKYYEYEDFNVLGGESLQDNQF